MIFTSIPSLLVQWRPIGLFTNMTRAQDLSALVFYSVVPGSHYRALCARVL